MANSKFTIKNAIDADDLWKGIGGHFDSLSQILHELIDNSVSNFKCNSDLNHHTILIKIENLDYKSVSISVEDTGTGIKDIDTAFTLGNTSNQESPLNEHGFGLKHALATANPKNDSWKIFTRTNNLVQKEEVLIISSKYKILDYEAEIVNFNKQNYPSKLDNYNSTGTIIQFKTSYEMYKSLGKYGTKDSKGIALYLKEDLGFIYSGIIKSGIVDIQIIVDKEPKMIVNAIEPWWEKTISPGIGKQKIDLGLYADSDQTGEITISYQFGTINNRESTNDNEKVVYYQTNMKSSGVEIRINGRMIKNNLLTEIWEKFYPHNRFNNFLVIIDLISDRKESLPATKSSKNGFKQGDIKLSGLYKWIKVNCSSPYENKNERDEVQLFDELKKIKESQLRDFTASQITIDVDRRVLIKSKEIIKIDLLVAYDNEIIIYNGKKGFSNSLDLYKLKLYWDACVIEGINPTRAILLAIEHNDLVQDLCSMNNSLKDIEGRNYNFILRKWKDEGINYPEKIIQ